MFDNGLGPMLDKGGYRTSGLLRRDVRPREIPRARQRGCLSFGAARCCAPRRVSVLSTHSAWLLGSLVLGCDGLLSGSGSVIADLQAALFSAVRADDLATARVLNDRIHPLAEVFYAEPWADMHNRMKEALVLLGRLPRAVVRPPLVKLEQAEIARIRSALVEAGLLSRTHGRNAA